MRHFLRLLAGVWLFCLPLAASAQDQEQSDRGFIQGILEDALSADGSRRVRIQGFEGALSSRATIDKIIVEDTEGVWLTASDIAMVWTRTALVRGRIEIDEISVGEIDVARLPVAADAPPSPEARSPFALPELPVSVNLEELTVDAVILSEALFGEAARISVEGSASLEGGEGTATLAVQRLDKGGQLSLDGRYSNDSRVLGLDLSVQEPEGGIAVNLLSLPGQPSVALTLQGESPVDDFEAALQLQTDGEERLGGTIILRADGDTDSLRFRVDVGGDIAPVVAPAYREFLGDDVRLVAEAARASDGRLTLDELDLRAQALRLTGSAALAADGWPETFDLQGEIAPPQGENVLLPGTDIRVAGADLSGTFDASAGNGWRLEARVAGLQQAAVEIDTLSLTGGGEISRITNRVDGALRLDASGMALADESQAQAVGTSLRGALAFDWQPGSPLILDEIDVSGTDYGVTGDVTISAIDTLNPIIVPDLIVRADDLSRFAALAGIDLRGAATLAVDGGVEPVTGAFDLDVSGNTQGLETGIAQVDPLIAGAGSLRLRARRNTEGLVVDTMRVATQAALIEGQLRLASGDSTAQLTARIAETSVVLPGISGESTVVVNANQTAERWKITADGVIPGAARLNYEGAVTTGGPDGTLIDGIAQASVTRLSAFSDLAGRRLSGAADLRIAGMGVPEAQTFDVTVTGTTRDLVLSVPSLDPVLKGTSDVRFVGSRDAAGRVDVEELRIDGAANATFTGWVEGNDVQTLAADGRLTAQVPDLSVFSGLAGRDLSGTVGLDLDAEGKLLDGPLTVSGVLTARNASISMPDIDPLLRGATRIDLNASRDADGIYELTRLETQGAANASFTGVLRGKDLESLTADGRLTAQVPDLSPFSGLAGRRLSGAAGLDVEADGQIMDGPLSVSLIATMDNSALSMPQFDSLLAGSTRIDLAARRDAEGLIDITRLETSGALDASYTGTLRQLPDDVALDGVLTASVPNLSAFSGLAGLPLRGSARVRAEVAGEVVDGPLQVQANVTGQNLATGLANLDGLLRGATQVDLDAGRDAAGVFRIQRALLDSSGVDATVSGQISGSQAALDLSVAVANVGLIVPDLSGPGSLRGTVRHSGGPWQVDLTGSGPGGIGATARGSVAQNFQSANLRLNGSAPLALANAYLNGQVVTGVLRFDVGVNGPLALSSVSGTLSAADARFAEPSLGVVLSDVTGDVQLSGGRANVNLGASLSTGGRIRATGSLVLAAPFQSDLVVELLGAQLQKAGLLETTADGRVTLNGPLTGGARIGGVINLGQVEVRIPNFGPSYSSLDGLRHVNTPPDVQRTLQFAGLAGSGGGGAGGAGQGASGPAFPIDLTVNAPNRIFVRGRGLEAELGGSLRLTGTTNNLVPVGQFDLVRGRLDLLGRRLDLTQGSVSLRGSFDPYIVFAATTTVEETAITISIEGFASEPELRVTSEPSLPQDEALAFFLFGRSVTSLSPLQAVQLAAAVRTLSGQGGLGLTDQLRTGLGVDEFDIGTDAEGNAQARIGKYISDNIYTDVEVGSDGTSEINLNLNVNDNVTVRGRVSSDGTSGVGVFFEKDY